MPVGAAFDWRLMQPGPITLPWPVAGRMAIGAARMSKHLAEFREYGGRSCVFIGDPRKALGACKGVGLGLGHGIARDHAGCDRNNDGNEKLKPQSHAVLPFAPDHWFAAR